MKALKLAVFVGVVVAVLPYMGTSVYDFPDAQHFSGAVLVNPYEGIGAVWQKSNFHAHSRAWGGVTNGRQAPEDVVRSYQSLGYAVAGVSNYQSIASHAGVPTMPLYEHGFNVGKRHQLAIGAHQVTWFDAPFVQFTSQKQDVINQVKATADLVAIVHPNGTVGYTEEDMELLSGYDLLEVANGGFTAADMWDVALSNGHRVWAIADDDTHDVDDLKRRAVAFNMVNAASASTRDIVAALRAGRTFAVSAPRRNTATLDSGLESLAVTGDTMTVTANGLPATIVFIGQDGAVRGQVDRAMQASYTFGPADTYVRTELRTAETTVYLNPVFRSGGLPLTPPAAPPVDLTRTWLLRVLLMTMMIVAIPLLWRSPRSARAAAGSVARTGVA